MQLEGLLVFLLQRQQRQQQLFSLFPLLQLFLLQLIPFPSEYSFSFPQRLFSPLPQHQLMLVFFKPLNRELLNPYPLII